MLPHTSQQKKLSAPAVSLVLLLLLLMPGSVFAVEFSFHGDFVNSFRLYSNQAKFFAGDFAYKTTPTAAIEEDSNSDFFANFKYRLWTEATSDNGAVRGVYAIEIGNIHFGDSKKGGAFSGDGVNVETRWAYTDLKSKHGRVRIGLQPVKINKFFWQETAPGVHYQNGPFQAAWYRGYELTSTDSASQDLDGYYLRYTFQPNTATRIGIFATWLTSDALTASDVAEYTAAGKTLPPLPGHYIKKMTGYDLDLYTVGIDGGTSWKNWFCNWDLLLQSGDFAEAQDFNGYFVHLDLGTKLKRGKLTYTFWYSSGDDNPDDADIDAFIATDCDTKANISSVVLFEGLAADTYFSATPYIQDKGLILNRIGYTYNVSDKLKIGAAALYLMTAEEIEYNQFKDDKIGTEVDLSASYKHSSQLEFALEMGYLFTDDAMDYYEVDQDGSADTDLFVINSRIRYKF